MGDIDIVLPTQTFHLSREFILQQMPGSLFANAIELDSKATELPINNPLITPEVMQFLVNYSHGIEPTHHLPELEAAEVYLNVPWMRYYSSPGYDLILDKVNPNAEVNRDGIEQIIYHDDSVAYQYLLSKGYDPPYIDLESAIYSPSTDIAKMILDTKDFTPQPSRKNLVNLIYAKIRGLPDIADDTDPTLVEGVVRDNMNYTRSLLDIALRLGQGRFQDAYIKVNAFSDEYPQEIPDIVFTCLYIMFAPPTDNPGYYEHAWQVARTIPWIPGLPEEPSNIFGQQ
jgi:hypothetical protein